MTDDLDAAKGIMTGFLVGLVLWVPVLLWLLT